MPEPEPLATTQQVADYLIADTQTLSNWRYRGVGPKFVKIGGLVRYRWGDVFEWVDSRVAQRTDDVPHESCGSPVSKRTSADRRRGG